MQYFFRCKLILVFLLLYIRAFSQEASIKYSNLISADSIRSCLYKLASDSMQGRETGKPGQKLAADFLASKYASWKLTSLGDSVFHSGNSQRSYLQNHPISLRNNKLRNLSVNSEYLLYGKDFFYSPGYADTTIDIHKLFFIITNDKEASWKETLKTNKFTKNNLVLYDLNNVEKLSFENVEAFLPKTQIVFIVTTEEKIKQHVSDNVFTFKNTTHPEIYISENVAAKLFDIGELEKITSRMKNSPGKYIKKIHDAIKVQLVKNTNQLLGQNVIAFLPGSDLNNETVVISSHYDHLGIIDSLIYFGADDNASGTSAVLELARVFIKAKNEGHGPRRNILFINVSGEEKGLYGSSWYVEHPAQPLANTIADLNIDMIGRTDPIHDSTGEKNYIYIIGSDKMSTELHEINESQNKLGPNMQLDYKYNSPDDPNRYYKRSDHYNFVKKGIPVIFYFDGNHKDYHKPTDTADKIDFNQLTQRAKLVFLTAWELANRDKRIVVDKKTDLDK